MSDFEGRPAQLKDKSGQPTGEWGAWVNGLPRITQVRQWKEEQVGKTVTVQTRAGEEREEVIAEVLYVNLPAGGEDDECWMLVRFGTGQPSEAKRSDLAQALLKEMRVLRKEISELRKQLASEQRAHAQGYAPAPPSDADLPF